MTIYKNIKTMSADEYKKARQDAVRGNLTLKEPQKAAKQTSQSTIDTVPKPLIIKPANKDAEDNRTVRYALKQLAKKAGIIDINDLSLVDISSVKVNDEDEIEGGEEFVEALKTAKPYLFGALK